MQQGKDDVPTLTNTGVKTNKMLDRDYYRLSKEQNGYGKAAIMLEMVENHELDEQGVREYFEYTTYINRLFTMYIGGSVLLFDREYRKLWFKEKFRWGVSCHHLQEFQLFAKPNDLTTQTLQRSVGAHSKRTKFPRIKGTDVVHIHLKERRSRGNSTLTHVISLTVNCNTFVLCVIHKITAVCLTHKTRACGWSLRGLSRLLLFNRYIPKDE